MPRPTYAGGVSGQVHLQAMAFARRGHEVTVFALNAPPCAATYAYQPIPLAAWLARRPRAALFLVPLAVARLRMGAFDIIHAHGEDHFLRTDRPVVRTFYGSSCAEALHAVRLRQRLYHRSMALAERLSARKARAVVAISASTGRYLGRSVHVIPCGYDPELFAPCAPKSETPSILFVGDLGTRKRADLLLRVFADRVRSALPHAELWMVTSAPAGGPGVRWLGRLDGRTLAETYSRAWVFCLPSAYEGFGVPYVEAMACGTPVVATVNGGAEDVLEGGRWGRLVSTEVDLGDALLELLTSSARRAELAELGRRRAKDFEIDRIAEQYEGLYRRALEPGASACGAGASSASAQRRSW